MYSDIYKEVSKYSAQLLAVSKLQPMDKIKNLYQQGQRLFAENYVQEAMIKIEQLKDLNIQWHFIGNLQKNKVKYIIQKFDLIHSIDNFELAEKINNYSEQNACTQKILIQVNLAEEKTKGGVSKEEIYNFVSTINKLKNISLQGLMTMPPLFDDPELARPYFQELRFLGQKLGLKELSMGTSSDYKIALQEGATIVRLGTMLFGERPHKNS